MLKKITEVKGAKKLCKAAQKQINGGVVPIDDDWLCGGDGSYIIVNEQIVCCWWERMQAYWFC